MDNIKGRVLANWDGFISCDQIKAGNEIGKGFKTKDEAVKLAREHKGSEAIIKSSDNMYHVYDLDIKNFTKDNIEQTKNYPVSNISKSGRVDAITPISFVTEDDYEFVSPDIHQNKFSSNNFDINKTDKKSPSLFGMQNWPMGNNVTEAQQEKAIKTYASLVIQQFKYENHRDPNPKELVQAVVKNFDKLPYKSTNDIDGKLRVFTDPIKIFGESNSSSIVFQTGTGRCGDMADLHYKFAMEAAKQLGIDKKMKNSLFIIGVEGVGGANVNHAAIGFIDSKKIQDMNQNDLSKATVFDPWMRVSKEQKATSWGKEYCFDLIKHPLLAVKNVLGPYTHKFQTTITDDRYKLSAFTPDYSLDKEFMYRKNIP